MGDWNWLEGYSRPQNSCPVYKLGGYLEVGPIWVQEGGGEQLRCTHSFFLFVCFFPLSLYIMIIIYHYYYILLRFQSWNLSQPESFTSDSAPHSTRLKQRDGGGTRCSVVLHFQPGLQHGASRSCDISLPGLAPGQKGKQLIWGAIAPNQWWKTGHTGVPCEDTVLCEVGEEVGSHCSGIICLMWSFPSGRKCTHVFTLCCLLLISPDNTYLEGRNNLTLCVSMKCGGRCESLGVFAWVPPTLMLEKFSLRSRWCGKRFAWHVTLGFPCHLSRGPWAGLQTEEATLWPQAWDSKWVSQSCKKPSFHLDPGIPTDEYTAFMGDGFAPRL